MRNKVVPCVMINGLTVMNWRDVWIFHFIGECCFVRDLDVIS